MYSAALVWFKPLPAEPRNTVKTRTDMRRPVREGARNALHGEGVSALPRRYRWIHSMVMRKQTTASPAKMPMKTARMRKKRSSLNASWAVRRLVNADHDG